MELIKSELTPRERLSAYARGEEVDRIPVKFSMGETAAPMYGIKISDYYFSADLIVEVESRVAQDFGADNMGVPIGLRTLPEALGSKLKYPDYNLSYIDQPVLKELSEAERLRFIDIEKDGRFPLIIEAFERLIEKYSQNRVLGCGLAGPITTAAGLYGTEKLLRATIKEKDLLHKLLRFCNDCIVDLCGKLNKKLGIKFMIADPIASKNILSKKQFTEFFDPYLKDIVNRLNAFQGSTSLHICGDTEDRWEEIVGSGISGFWLDNCMNMKRFKEAFGEKAAIMGNAAPVSVLKDGTPEEIREEVKRCILEAADNPKGFTLCPGCTTPVGTPRENVIAFMNAAAVYGRGAKKGCMPKGALESR